MGYPPGGGRERARGIREASRSRSGAAEARAGAVGPSETARPRVAAVAAGGTGRAPFEQPPGDRLGAGGVDPLRRTPENGGYLPRWSPPEWTSARGAGSPKNSNLRRWH